MSNIISVLEKMASDASLKDANKINSTVKSANITDEEQQAILANDVNFLKDVSQNIPSIECFVLLPAEDDEPEEEGEENDNESSDTKNELQFVVNG